MLDRPTYTPWKQIPTDERTRLIMAHCKTGMSGGEVVAILCDLGISGHNRNSVIGHVHRNMRSIFRFGTSPANLPWLTRGRKDPPVERRRPPMPIRVKVKAKPAAPNYARPEPSLAPESLKLLCEELKPNSCRYIAGDPKDGGTYCGHETVPDESWCSYHMGIVYQPSRVA